MRGTVKRVVKMPGEHSAAAALFIRFPDGDESYQAGTNLEKGEAAENGGKK
jgi:hypothetical protein